MPKWENILKGYADEAFYRRWQRDMVDYLTREDVRDLTRIMAVEHIATLMQIMPERVGAPLSLNALTEDVEFSESPPAGSFLR
jgi:hypothetical protein